MPSDALRKEAEAWADTQFPPIPGASTELLNAIRKGWLNTVYGYLAGHAAGRAAGWKEAKAWVGMCDGRLFDVWGQKIRMPDAPPEPQYD